MREWGEKRRRCYKVIYSDIYTVVDMLIVPIKDVITS